MASFRFGQAHDGADMPASAGMPEHDAGPGWYDSSWDLRRGLIVREGLPRDAQLHEWLQHELLGSPVGAETGFA